MDSSDWTHIRTDTTTAYQFRENVLEEEKKEEVALVAMGKKKGKNFGHQLQSFQSKAYLTNCHHEK